MPFGICGFEGTGGMRGSLKVEGGSPRFGARLGAGNGSVRRMFQYDKGWTGAFF